MKESELTYNVRKAVFSKASELDIDISTHLDFLPYTYCIKIGNKDLDKLSNNAGILCDNIRKIYRVYSTEEEALSVAKKLSLTDNATIITEEEAIKIMCEAECSPQEIGGFSITQIPGGGLEIRANDHHFGTLFVEPVMGNSIKIFPKNNFIK